MGELDDAVYLMDLAGNILHLLSPARPILRYYAGDLNEEELRDEFLDRFWPKERGEWREKPGSRVMTLCISQYFVELKREIANIIFPEVGRPIEFLYKGKPMNGSLSWITYWQQGASGLTGGMEGEDYGKETNRDLALQFYLRLDPRMIAASESTDCSMSPLVQTAIDRMMTRWAAQWSWKPLEDSEATMGESIITLTNLLDCFVGKDSYPVHAFGIPSHDKDKGHWLIHGLCRDEPVMAVHLREQIFEAINMDALKVQIERAPKK